jgi:hypothetical protein
MKKRFPLEPLLTIRRDRVEQKGRALGDAERRAQTEQAALDEARERRTAAEDRARAARALERRRLEAGLERARDLTRAELHHVRERLRLEALGDAAKRAEKRRNAAERAVEGARAALGDARSAARLVERQEQKFRRAGAAKESAVEDEAAADFHAVLARRRRG